jgi:predicted ATPase
LLNQFVIDASQSDVLVAAVHPGRDGCQSLCEAILRQLPLRCDESLDRHNAALSALFSQLQRRVGPSEISPQAQETSLLSALQSELLALSERVTLVVLVDDLQLCDEASAGLFANLAASARNHRLLLVATRQTGAQVVAVNAVQRMSQQARRVLLRPLDPHSIEELVRSTFVGAPQVKRVAEWAVTLSDGNPAKVVELLRYLVERDIARFGAGAWYLPEQIAAHLLPGAMAEALRARVDSLSPAAREVAELVCVSAYPQELATLRLTRPSFGRTSRCCARSMS